MEALDRGLLNDKDRTHIVGAVLCHLRKESGLTQTHLSELTGIDQPTLSRYEKGRVKLTLVTWIHLGQCRCDLEYANQLLAATVEKYEDLKTKGEHPPVYTAEIAMHMAILTMDRASS